MQRWSRWAAIVVVCCAPIGCRAPYEPPPAQTVPDQWQGWRFASQVARHKYPLIALAWNPGEAEPEGERLPERIEELGIFRDGVALIYKADGSIVERPVDAGVAYALAKEMLLNGLGYMRFPPPLDASYCEARVECFGLASATAKWPGPIERSSDADASTAEGKSQMWRNRVLDLVGEK